MCIQLLTLEIQAGLRRVHAQVLLHELPDKQLAYEIVGIGMEDRARLRGLLGSAPIMAVNRFSSDQFIRRGGRIPAPVHSLRN